MTHDKLFPVPKDLNGILLYHAEFMPSKWRHLWELHEKYAKEYGEKAKTETSPQLRKFFRKSAEWHEAELDHMKQWNPIMEMDAKRAKRAMEEMR